MPKALWSTDEKNLFFEALNEYGKDFDAITAYICAKMKKKGMPDVNLKTKTQVSHFYYRTWHKLSKHVHFDESKFFYGIYGVKWAYWSPDGKQSTQFMDS